MQDSRLISLIAIQVLVVIMSSGCEHPKGSDLSGAPIVNPPIKSSGRVLLDTGRSDWCSLFSESGDRLAVVSDPYGPKPCIRSWDTRSGKPVGPELNHGREFHELSFDASGQKLLTECTPLTADVTDTRREARLWDVQTGRLLLPPITHDGELVEDAALSPDGKMVATCTDLDDLVHVWCAETGRLLWSVQHKGFAWHLQFERSGRLLITTGEKALVWDVGERTVLHEFPRDRLGPITPTKPALSTNGRIAVATCFGVDVYALDTGTLLTRMEPQISRPAFEDLQCDDQMKTVVAIISSDLHVFDIKGKGHVTMPRFRPSDYRLSPSGDIIAVYGAGQPDLVDVRLQHHAKRGRWMTGIGNQWHHATFDETGERMAIIDAEAVHLINVDNRQEVRSPAQW